MASERISRLMLATIEYDKGDPRRIQHLIKVHDLAAVIGRMENMPGPELEVLEAAAVLHDIGIHLSEEKYGSSSGKYQEIEGPDEAEKLLIKLNEYSDAEIERIRFLISHHHTYNNIDGLDYQILVEADFIVNLYEDNSSMIAIESVFDKIFKTKSGMNILKNMFMI